MELTYEETMRRIEKIEKESIVNYKCCREKRFPYQVHFYKGEGQLIIVPLINCIGWYLTEMAWYRQITDTENAKLIGEVFMEALEHIRVSLVDARTKSEREEDRVWRKVTKYKSYKTFDKNYLFCAGVCYEDGSCVVCPGGHNEEEIVYNGEENEVRLEAGYESETLGNAIIEAFADMEEFYKNFKKQKKEPPRTTFDTISEAKISFVVTSDEVYTDEEDYNTAEIYQGYSYRKDDAEESVADMYFSIAADLDCDTTLEHIRSVYEAYDGVAESFSCVQVDHPVFEQRIEMETAKVHRIVYLKTVDESELLDCELVIKKKLAGKRLHDKIIKDFEKMVKTCRAEK